MPNSLVTAATVDRRIVRQLLHGRRRYYADGAPCGCGNLNLCRGRSSTSTAVPCGITPIAFTCYWRERGMNEGLTSPTRCSGCTRTSVPVRQTRAGNFCADCMANQYTPCWGCERPIRNSQRRQSWCLNNPAVEAELELNTTTRLLVQAEQYESLSAQNPHYRLWLCRNCEYIDPNACEVCQESVDEQANIELINFNGQEQRVCEFCRTQVLSQCAGCEEWSHINTMLYGARRPAGQENVPPSRYCRGCYADWPSCTGCSNRAEPSEMRNGECCLDCVRRTISQNIMPYHVDPLTYLSFQTAGRVDAVDASNGLFFGAEIELEYVGVRKQRAALDAVELVKTDVGDIAILKHDGSLDCGIEIVSAPMTLARHHQATWDARLAKIHQAFQPRQSCGLHIHVSRSELAENHVRLISEFIFKPENYEFVKFMARRDENRYARIKDVNPHDRTNNSNRYLALNTSKDTTIEFRMFASTTSGRAFYGSLEFVAALVEFAKRRQQAVAPMTRGSGLPLLEMRVPNFLEFVERLDNVGYGRFKSVVSAYTTGLGF